MKLKTGAGSEFVVMNPAGSVIKPKDAVVMSSVARDSSRKIESLTIATAKGEATFQCSAIAGLGQTVLQAPLVIYAGGKLTLSVINDPTAQIGLNFVSAPFSGLEAQAILDEFYAAVNRARPGLAPLKVPPVPMARMPGDKGEPMRISSPFAEPDMFPTPVTRAIPTHP
jgi:hypothetical protein